MMSNRIIQDSGADYHSSLDSVGSRTPGNERDGRSVNVALGNCR